MSFLYGLLPVYFHPNAPYGSATDITTLFFTGNSTFLEVCGVDIGEEIKRASIQLSNGAVYDPFQTYQAPLSLGNYTFDAIAKSKGYTSPQNQQNIEYTHHLLRQYVGHRGLLSCMNFNNAYSQCLARFQSIKSRWDGHMYDHYEHTGKEIQVVRYTFTFERLNAWADEGTY